MSRPWALLISPIRPDAFGSGLAQRAWQWAVELSSACELLTIVVATHEGLKQGTTAVPGRLELIDVEAGGATEPQVPDWMHISAAMQSEFDTILPRTAPARIILFRFYTHPLVELLPESWRPIAEMDLDDWESETRWSLAKLAFRHTRYRDAYDHFNGSRGYARLEREILPRYRRIHVAASEDVELLAVAVRGAKIVARPNCIADTVRCVSETRMPGKRLLFVGTLDYLPNEDAAMWLVHEIAPRVRERFPGTVIGLAGRRPSRSVMNLRGDGVEYLGAPDDLSEYYAAASIAVAPIRGGGGTKLKVPEAWLHRRPLVATTHAARGYGARHGTHLLIGDTAAEFASACVSLLEDERMARQLAEAGYCHIKSSYLLPRVELR